MRKLVVSMNLTLDGYMAGPTCELDWHFRSWTPDMANTLCCQLSQADTLLLGGTTYRAMARYWPSKVTDTSFPRVDLAFAHLINSCNKIVVTTQPLTATWGHTQVIKGGLVRSIRQLKKGPGKNIMVYGSGKLVAALQQMDAVDEWHLWLYPVVIGRGKPLFTNPAANLHLLRTEVFSSGVVLLVYQCRKVSEESDAAGIGVEGSTLLQTAL